MSDRQFTNDDGDNLWSNALNWLADTKPANGESVQISADCTFDEDLSGWANGVAGIVGDPGTTLSFKTTGGPYYLKTSAAVKSDPAGTPGGIFTVSIGSLGSNYTPTLTCELTAVGHLFECSYGDTGCIMDFNVYDRSGTGRRWGFLAGTVTSGANKVLTLLDKNLDAAPADAIQVGDAVEMVDGPDSIPDAPTVTAVNHSTAPYTITVDSLSQGYSAGDLVALNGTGCSNVTMIGPSAFGNDYFMRGDFHGGYIRCAVTGFGYGIGSTPGHMARTRFMGSSYETDYFLYQGGENTLGGVHRGQLGSGGSSDAPMATGGKGHIFGKDALIYTCERAVLGTGEGACNLNGCIAFCHLYAFVGSGIVRANGLVIHKCERAFYKVTPSGRWANVIVRDCGLAWFTTNAGKFLIDNLVLSGNTTDFYGWPPGSWAGYGVNHGLWANSATVDGTAYDHYSVQSFGEIATKAAPEAGGPDSAELWTFSDDIGPMFWDERVYLAAGQTLKASSQCWEDGAGYTQDFKLAIIKEEDDPFLVNPTDPTNDSGLTQSEASHTGAAGWETLGVSHKATADGYFIVRLTARADTPEVGYATFEIKKPSGGGAPLALP